MNEDHPLEISPVKPLPASSLHHFTLTLDGQTVQVPLSNSDTLLSAALQAGIDVPYACQEGHCGSCMAKLVSGKVEMASTKALSKVELESGWILSCQAFPIGDEPLSIDYDG